MPGLPPLASVVIGCALLAAGFVFAFNAGEFFGDWSQADPLTRIFRRLFGAAIIMRLIGAMRIVFGALMLVSAIRRLLSS